MLRLLVGDENLQVVEIALAVVAPWTVQELLEGGTASFLAHFVELRSVELLKSLEGVRGCGEEESESSLSI